MYGLFHSADAQGAGWFDATPPLRIPKLNVVKLRKKTMDCSRWLLATGGAFFFYLRSIFDTVMRGQRSIFREIDNILPEHAFS